MPSYCQWYEMTGQEPQAQTGTSEVPYGHDEEHLYCDSDRALEQAAQGGCGDSPEIFKICLCAFLCDLLWEPALEIM